MREQDSPSTILIRRTGSGQILKAVPASTLRSVDLRNADLSEAFLKDEDLSSSYLSGAIFRNAFLEGAILSNASLEAADLSSVNLNDSKLNLSQLSGASLRQANIRRADLTGAFLYETDMYGANLSSSRLSKCQMIDTMFINTILSGADFEGASMWGVVFANCPTLGEAVGLDKIRHDGPCSIDSVTLRASIDRLPDSFLEGCGYTQFEIAYLRSLYREKSIAMYSCFISHAEADLVFADRLLADLRQANVTCWHYKDSLRGGRDWQPQIDEAIKVHDKLVLICSRQSVYRENVVKEILRAIDVERQTGEQKLFPLMLDRHILGPEMMEEAREMVATRVWRENWVLHIKRKHILDFSAWDKDNDKYTRELKNLLSDLKQSN